MNPGRASGLFQCLPPPALKQNTWILFQKRGIMRQVKGVKGEKRLGFPQLQFTCHDIPKRSLNQANLWLKP